MNSGNGEGSRPSSPQEGDEYRALASAATRAYQAWVNQPAREVAREMYQMAVLLGLVPRPEKKVVHVDRPPEEMYEGQACSISGG